MLSRVVSSPTAAAMLRQSALRLGHSRLTPAMASRVLRLPSRLWSATPKRSSTLEPLDTFPRRHFGPSKAETKSMLEALKLESMEELVSKTVPQSIRVKQPLRLQTTGLASEKALIDHLREIAGQNQILKSYIGMGYYNCITPAVIQRNILENPQWYTQYTPYQPEISQGRLESLLNYQTMVTDLTGMSIANASLLDEGTAAAEALMMCFVASKRTRKTFFVDQDIHPQTLACLKTRAESFDLNIVVGDLAKFDIEANKKDLFGVLIQYPTSTGRIVDYEPYVTRIKDAGAQVCCATDLLALTVLKPPGEFGVDIAFGNSQRFGVPMGFGGPHAAFFACKDEHKRRLPGRLIGVSKDAQGKRAYRLSLQTREQHIRREKATSNICTAQALLANMSAMFGVYHGPKGLKEIAVRVNNLAAIFAEGVRQSGHELVSDQFFDTVAVKVKNAKAFVQQVEARGANLRLIDDQTVGVSFDEAVSRQDLKDLLSMFGVKAQPEELEQKLALQKSEAVKIPSALRRTSAYMTHPVFNSYHSETEMLRYISRLQAKDLSLANTMIPLGSCTMKLNATTEMLPVTWPEFASLHPFVPQSQTKGYQILFKDLVEDLKEITGLDDVSLQPNSGAQGEYAGLRVIRAFQASQGQQHRNVCLIPSSAHGTNPASAHMAGMEVVPVKCDVKGNLDMADVAAKLKEYKDTVSTMMITYPSTYGFFDEGVAEVCEMVHQAGGQVYLDGANLNAQVGVCRPGDYGADVIHMNLHKTFCIPHGGGGPGMGPIAVKKHLGPFLPGHPVVPTGGEHAIGPISAAPWGSADILSISWAYIKMMGANGLREATELSILNANYMAHRLAPHYKILYTNKHGMCAHEFILDARPFQETAGIEAIDIAKRLQDYGFHSPTMSWPVGNTLMLEPTESESKAELDRFCDALIAIRKEITEVEQGQQPRENNVLTNAPHPLETLLTDAWDRPYSRERAAYPLTWLRASHRGKFWPTTNRLDDTFGDRNLVCACPPMEAYEKP